MDFTSYLVDNALILVPVMYFIGFCIKNTKVIKDKYIPIILLPIGILFSLFLLIHLIKKNHNSRLSYDSLMYFLLLKLI